jgi:hypothetical protein
MSKTKATESMGVPPSIVDALVNAQMAIAGVSKDGQVDFGRKYNYTTAEEMIRESRKALHACGLAVVRKAWRLRVIEAMPCVECDFVLLFRSGESMEFANLCWPVIEGDKRPADKALAGALTTSFAYFLRDLLLIPKQDDAEMDKRNDEEHRAGVLGVRGAVALRKRLAAVEATQETLVEVMSSKGVSVPEDMAQWSQSLLPRIDKWVEARLNTLREQDAKEA